MSVPTYYVCPHLLCLSSPIMSVLTYYVCPQLLCLFLPIMSIVVLVWDWYVFVLVCPHCVSCPQLYFGYNTSLHGLDCVSCLLFIWNMMISGSRTVSRLARLEGQLGQFLSTTSVSNRLSRHTWRFSPISSTGIISGMFSICDASKELIWLFDLKLNNCGVTSSVSHWWNFGFSYFYGFWGTVETIK